MYKHTYRIHTNKIHIHIQICISIYIYIFTYVPPTIPSRGFQRRSAPICLLAIGDRIDGKYAFAVTDFVPVPCPLGPYLRVCECVIMKRDECLYTYIYICIHIYIYVYTVTYVHMYTYMYIHIYMYMYIYIYI